MALVFSGDCTYFSIYFIILLVRSRYIGTDIDILIFSIAKLGKSTNIFVYNNVGICYLYI